MAHKQVKPVQWISSVLEVAQKAIIEILSTEVVSLK